MTWKGPWPGTWAAICQRCGFRLPSNKLLKEWTGLMVCSECWEHRHEQDFIRLKEETIVPPWVSPVPTDVYVAVCTQFTIQGLADIGTADCAQADINFHYTLYDMCPRVPTSIAGVSVAGCLIAGAAEGGL